MLHLRERNHNFAACGEKCSQISSGGGGGDGGGDSPVASASAHRPHHPSFVVGNDVFEEGTRSERVSETNQLGSGYIDR